MKPIKEGFDWPIISMVIGIIMLWVCVYMFGFFQTVMWYIIACAIIGIIVKLKEGPRV
jgi:uncharacterized membrane protein